ncbi:MAG: IclR family transcriptional regulator [Alphaproteobacteria bacterium]|nr:IclR family transcriptional regulator [Alphaproteobacteria bacterium]
MGGGRRATEGQGGARAVPRPVLARGIEAASARAVPAVTRGVSILKLLARSHEPLGVIAIARALAIVPSTALHILRALVAEQLVAFDATTKRYTLDAGILALARSLLRQDRFSVLAQPHLDAIAETHGVTAIGTRVLGLAHMIVVAISRSELMLRLHVDIGSRYPALISATGRCLAAFGGLPEPALRRAFERLRWHNAPDFARWKREVEQARRIGYGVDDGDYIGGITIVAAPVFRIDGRMTHALAVVALHDQTRSDRIDAIGQATRTAALSISAQLGFAPSQPMPTEATGYKRPGLQPAVSRKRTSGTGNGARRSSAGT